MGKNYPFGTPFPLTMWELIIFDQSLFKFFTQLTYYEQLILVIKTTYYEYQLQSAGSLSASI